MHSTAHLGFLFAADFLAGFGVTEVGVADPGRGAGVGVVGYAPSKGSVPGSIGAFIDESSVIGDGDSARATVGIATRSESKHNRNRVIGLIVIRAKDPNC